MRAIALTRQGSYVPSSVAHYMGLPQITNKPLGLTQALCFRLLPQADHLAKMIAEKQNSKRLLRRLSRLGSF